MVLLPINQIYRPSIILNHFSKKKKKKKKNGINTLPVARGPEVWKSLLVTPLFPLLLKCNSSTKLTAFVSKTLLILGYPSPALPSSPFFKILHLLPVSLISFPPLCPSLESFLHCGRPSFLRWPSTILTS